MVTRVPYSHINLFKIKRGRRTAWGTELVDVQGYLQSKITDNDIVYIERKIAEWWPDLPVKRTEDREGF